MRFGNVIVRMGGKVNYKQTTTAGTSWQSRTEQIIANAPNGDWRKSGFRLLPGEVEIPLSFYNPANGYKSEEFGKAKAVFGAWESPEGSFIGFIVAEFGGALDSAAVINLKGEWTEDAKQSAMNSVARHLENRRCPKCAKIDTLNRTSRTIRCTARPCGYRESAI